MSILLWVVIVCLLLFYLIDLLLWILLWIFVDQIFLLFFWFFFNVILLVLITLFLITSLCIAYLRCCLLVFKISIYLYEVNWYCYLLIFLHKNSEDLSCSWDSLCCGAFIWIILQNLLVFLYNISWLYVNFWDHNRVNWVCKFLYLKFLLREKIGLFWNNPS